MSKRSVSAKKTISPITSYKVIHWVLFLLVLVNVALVFLFERDRVPRVVHEQVTTISNHVYVVTNVIYSIGDKDDSSSATNKEGRLILNDPNYEIPLSYHFYQSGSRYYIQVGGFQFGVGDMTSYGRIKSIFPERVLLDNGYALKNNDFEERYGFSQNAIRSRREIERYNVFSNSSFVVPIHLYPGETVIPGSRRLLNE